MHPKFRKSWSGCADLFSPPAGRLVTLGLLLAVASPARAATYYVALGGSDSAAGTQSQPFKTLSKAAKTVAAGDTVYLRGGTYYEQLKLTKAGTSSARITFSAYNGETVVLDGSGLSFTSGGLVQVDSTADYNTVIGLTLRDSPNRGVSSNGDQALFDGLKISNSYKAGVSINDSTGSEVRNSEVWNNVLENENDRYIVQGKTGGWAPALTCEHSSNITYSHNKVHDNWGEGISAYYNSSDIHYVGNTSYDNYGVNIYVDGARDSVVEDNLVYETNTTYMPRFVNGKETTNWRRLATGIAVSEEDYYFKDPDYTCQMANNVIKNNIVINTRMAFTNYNYMSCGGLKNTKVVNNTFVDTWDIAVRATAGLHSATLFQNNIMHARQGGTVVDFGSPNDTKFENNLLYKADGSSTNAFSWNGTRYTDTGWDAASTRVTNNLWAEPRLVSLGKLSGDLAANHKLTSSSPAIDKGLAITTTSHDYWDNVRPVDGDRNGSAAYDIGAHEYPASTTPPPSPVYLINDDFNGQSTGSAPSGYSSSSATVSDTPSSSNKSIKFNDTATNARAQMTRSFASQSRALTLEVRFMVPDEIDYSSVCLQSAGAAVSCVMTLGGNLVHLSGDAVYESLQPYTPNTWYSLKAVVDPSTHQVDVYVNGTLAGAQLDFATAADSLDAFAVTTGNSATGLTYVDDVKVSYQP